MRLLGEANFKAPLLRHLVNIGYTTTIEYISHITSPRAYNVNNMGWRKLIQYSSSGYKVVSVV